MVLYNNKFIPHTAYNKIIPYTAYTDKGISKANNFLCMASFPYVLSQIYQYSTLVATCEWLANRQEYISTKDMFQNPSVGLFRRYNSEDIFSDTVKLNQRIFALGVNWVIYSSLEDMVEDLEWDKGN